MRTARAAAAVLATALSPAVFAQDADETKRLPGAAVRVWDLPQEPSIVVTGTADLSRAPDEAVLVVGAVAEAATAAEAQASMNKIMTRATDAILRTGLAEHDLRTTGLSVLPVYDLSGISRRSTKIQGYRAESAVEVRTQPERIAPVIDAAMHAGATSIDELSFGLEVDDAAKRAVLRDAFTEARAKASAIAAAGGFELGEVIEVVERVEPIQRGEVTRFALRDLLEDADGRIEPGRTDLRGRVSVRFEIRPLGREPARTAGHESPPPR